MTMRDITGFLIAQTAYIETDVYQREYEQITYPDLVMVDERAGAYASAIVHFSSDQTGVPALLNQLGGDIPLVQTQRAAHVVPIHEYGLGYTYTYPEIQQAMMAGRDLDMEKPQAASLASATRLQAIFESGIPEVNLGGFNNYGGVNVSVATAGGDGSPNWNQKDPDEILTDITNAIQGIFVSTRKNHIPNSLALPTGALIHLAGRRLDETRISLMEYIRQNNAYTTLTGMPLRIVALSGLDTAATGSVAGQGRMVMFRNSEDVVRFHLPMPYQISNPIQTNGWTWRWDGMMRVGGLEIRIPEAFRYVDGVWPAP